MDEVLRTGAVGEEDSVATIEGRAGRDETRAVSMTLVPKMARFGDRSDEKLGDARDCPMDVDRRVVSVRFGEAEDDEEEVGGWRAKAAIRS